MRKQPRIWNKGTTAPPSKSEAGVSDTRCHSRRRRMAVYRFLCVLGGLLVGWFLAELLLLFHEPQSLRTKRILLHRGRQGVDYHCYPSNPNGEFKPVPNVSEKDWILADYTVPPSQVPLSRLPETPYCVAYRYSSQHLRDREYSEKPRPGVLRIVAVGDSFTLGEGVPLEHTLPRQMETILGPGYEVVNAGSVGVGADREAKLLPAIVAGLHCPRAIVVFIINDIYMTEELKARQDFINDLIIIRDRYLAKHKADAWYAGRSRLLSCVGSWWDMQRIRRNTIQWYRDCYNEKLNGKNLKALDANLRKMAETPNCRVAFVMYPLIESLERNYLFRDIHKRVGAMAHQAGMPVLDLAGVFVGNTTSSLQVHPADHHPNGQAHAIAAKAIIEWLRNDVPGFLDRKTVKLTTPSSPHHLESRPSD